MLQGYQLVYYLSCKDYPKDKICLLSFMKDREDSELKKAVRSIYFAELPQLRRLFLDLIKSYFYWLDHRIKPVIPQREYRIMMLNGLLQEIDGMMREEWKQ